MSFSVSDQLRKQVDLFDSVTLASPFQPTSYRRTLIVVDYPHVQIRLLNATWNPYERISDLCFSSTAR